MNEQIEALMIKASNGSCYDGSGEAQLFGDDIKKFAELIVRECAEVVKWTPSQFPNDEYVKNIKEHFGVE